MKKILVYLLLLIVGIGIGYFIGFQSGNKDIVNQEPEKNDIKTVNNHVIKKKSNVDKNSKRSIQIDTLTIIDTVFITDTLTTEEEIIDNPEEKDKDEVIIMEELVAQRLIPLTPSKEDTTDVSGMLELKSTSFSKDIMVEFWQSPLNITGYELTRNRLKLFGFNPNESISLQLDKNEEQILLNSETMSIVLQKSKQFKTLKLK